MQLKLKDFSLSILSKIIPEIAPNVKARIVRGVICVMSYLQLRRLDQHQMNHHKLMKAGKDLDNGIVKIKDVMK